MTDIRGHAKIKTHKDVAHNEKFTTEALPDKGKNPGQSETDQSIKDNSEKFPLDWDNPTEEEKKKWFTVGKVAGHEVLKVKIELLPPPEDEGEPIFLSKRTSYKQRQLNPVFKFDDDF
jgi:hypothetical protein